jgi:hypothetical protein
MLEKAILFTNDHRKLGSSLLASKDVDLVAIAKG